MKIQKTILILYLTSLFIAVYGLVAKNDVCIIIGHILPSLFIAYWYFSQVKQNLNRLNIQMIIWLSSSAVSDIILIFLPNSIGLNLNIFAGLIFNCFLIYVIRSEGVRLYVGGSENLKFKIIIPFIIVFLFFGKIILPVVPELTLLSTTLYSLIEILLLAHFLVRKPFDISYKLSVSGSILLLFKDFLFSFHFFIFKSLFGNLYFVIFPLGSIAYFLIVAGLVEKNRLNPILETNKKIFA